MDEHNLNKQDECLNRHGTGTVHPATVSTKEPQDYGRDSRCPVCNGVGKLPKDRGLPPAYGAEDLTDMFISKIQDMISYWHTTKRSSKWQLEGLAQSILNMLDGGYGMPRFDVVARPHPSDKEYCIDKKEPYIVDGTKLESDLHSIFRAKQIPTKASFVHDSRSIDSGQCFCDPLIGSNLLADTSNVTNGDIEDNRIKELMTPTKQCQKCRGNGRFAVKTIDRFVKFVTVPCDECGGSGEASNE